MSRHIMCPGFWMIRSISIVLLLGAFLLSFPAGPLSADEKTPREKNLIIIGRSSLRPPLAQHLEALIESHETPMNVEEGHFGAKHVDQMLNARRDWDYVIMDA